MSSPTRSKGNETPVMFEDGARFYLPELPCRFPLACHPRYEQIRNGDAQWVRAHLPFPDRRALANFLEHQYPLWVCLILPSTQEERTLAISCLTSLLFAIDDSCYGMKDAQRRGYHATTVFDRLMAAMKHEASASSPGYARALYDVWAKMSAKMPLGQQERLIAAIKNYLYGCAVEIAARAKGEIFDYDTYLRVRKDSVGGKQYFVMAEYGLGIDLSTDVLAQLGAIHDAALEQLILVNDLFSFRTEYYAQDYMNAILVLRHDEGLGLQDAVDKVCGLIHASEQTFTERRDRILDAFNAPADLRIYLDEIEHIMSGNLRWSYLTPRYHGVGYSWNGFTSGTVTLHPDRTVFSPTSVADSPQASCSPVK